ncbi:MAG: amidase family protein, partial [Bacteroidota bacterium]
MPSSRRQFMSYFSAAGLGGTLFPGTLWTLKHAAGQHTSDDAPITVEMIEQAEQIAGLTFSPEHRELMVEDVNDNLDAILALRERPLLNETAPALIFDPARLVPVPPAGPTTVDWQAPGVSKPASSKALAFLPVTELAALMRAGEVTSVELTRLYLSRLKQYDPVLKCVVTLTEERALQQAAERDAELAAGTWRGPLHGIPWGAKDLLAVE